MPLAVAAAMAAGEASAADMPVKAPAQQQTAAVASPWSTTANLDFRYFSWERTQGNPVGQPNQKGSQFYAPFGLSATGPLSEAWKLELTARGGYVSTSRSADPGDGLYRSASVATATDTVVGFTVTYLNINGFVPFYSLNLNLPTGTTNLKGDKPIARTDADLVDVPAFGAGFNHSHTLGANVALNANTVLTLSAGYTNRGAFNRDSVGFGLPATVTEHYNPGDNYSLSAGIGTELGPLSLNVSTAFQWETNSTLDGVDLMRSGFNTLLTGTVGYRWSDVHSSALNLSYTHSNRNYSQGFFGPPLVPDAFNSNSNIFNANFEHTVTVMPNAQIFGKLAYLNRDANSYDPANFAFVSAKKKYTIGGGARYGISDTVLLNARLDRFWITEQPYPALPTPEQKFTGWVTSVGAIVKF